MRGGGGGNRDSPPVTVCPISNPGIRALDGVIGHACRRIGSLLSKRPENEGNKPPRNSGKDFHGNISQASDGPYQQSMGLDIGQVSVSPLLHLANVVGLAPVSRDVFVQR